MNILLLTQVLPYPLDSGPKIRIYYVLKHLTKRYKVTLVALIRSEHERQYVSVLSSLGIEVHAISMPRSYWHDILSLGRSMSNGQPFMILRHYSQDVQHTIDTLLQNKGFDLIHVDQIKMAQYAQHVTWLPRLIDKHNAYAFVVKGVAETDPSPLKRMVARMEWPRLARYEGQVCRTFDQILAVTEKDKKTLTQFAGQECDITVMPIAIDASNIQPVHRQEGARDILSIGSMFYPPNVDGTLWFVEQAYPLVKAQMPDVKLYLVGSRPARSIVRLGQRDPSIIVTGYVEDTIPYIERSALLIAPLHFGSGMRVKILDALTRGIPIVSTSFGCEGIAVTHGQDILIADRADDFATAVLRVIQDRELAHNLAANGRRLVEEVYDWRVVYRTLDEVYARMLRSD